MICNLDLEGYVGCGKRLSAMLCLVIISLWFIHPASAGAAGSEVPAEEKKEAVVPASAGATESEVPTEEKKEAVVNKKLRTKSGGRFLPPGSGLITVHFFIASRIGGRVSFSLMNTAL